jgi:hypothetical protein
MTDPIRISLASPPDREHLVAEIIISNEQWAEINQDGERPVLEIYPRRDGRPWSIDFDTAVAALMEAREKLGSKSA